MPMGCENTVQMKSLTIIKYAQDEYVLLWKVIFSMSKGDRLGLLFQLKIRKRGCQEHIFLKVGIVYITKITGQPLNIF